jgi:hypothetical protein
MCRSVLRKVGDGFEGEVRVGDQIAEGQQGSPVGWHTFMVRRDRQESN